MKKLISAISTAFLIFMIPALFVAYLYSNTLVNTAKYQKEKNKIEQSNSSQEISFKPGFPFTVKG